MKIKKNKLLELIVLTILILSLSTLQSKAVKVDKCCNASVTVCPAVVDYICIISQDDGELTFEDILTYIKKSGGLAKLIETAGGSLDGVIKSVKLILGLS